ncbi:hypothetical protein GE09DRAFT_83718 [Coniochaeta sp. 2T2.1]|nr:hypothetical protein GE09DRAFT_83718 [Coniochaeta sp. 2T2.1]
MAGHSFMRPEHYSLLERSYGLGWIRTQLPGEVGAMGLNPWLARMPVAHHSRLAIYHQGNLPGATSAVYLFPETRSGVVVLANAYGLSDAPDWISQLIMDTLFETNSTTDYVKLTEDAVREFQRSRSETVRDIDSMRGTSPSGMQALATYVGRFENAGGSFVVDVFVESGALKLAFQGLGEEVFPLEHLHGEVFTWFTSIRDLAQHGRQIFPAPHYLIRFHRNSMGKVVSLEWAHNGTTSGGEFFVKDYAAWPASWLGLSVLSTSVAGYFAVSRLRIMLGWSKN